MSEQLRQQQVQPGPCPIDPETGLPICPPPTEIDIIKVRKVFNECMHTQVEELSVTFTSTDTSNATEAQCVSSEVSNISCTTLNGDIVRITFDVEVCSRVPLNSGGFITECTTESVSKTIRIDRAGEEGLDVQCHVFPECLFCFIAERDTDGNVTSVTCCVGVLILVKVDAEVQLLIPTYGYPAQPPECGEFIGECPTDFTPDWPPYPPQQLVNASVRKKGCK